MVDATLFYRTTGTISTAIASLPSAQKLVFTAPNNIFEAVDEYYENTIVKIPSVNAQGIRKSFNTDNGLRTRTFKIRGRLKQPTTDVTKINTFRVLPQSNSTHVHGIFGIDYPTAPFFSINPTASLGLMIGMTHVGHTGKILTRAFFEMELHFGGQLL